MPIYSIVVVDDETLEPKIWKSFTNYHDATNERQRVEELANFLFGVDNCIVKIVDSDLEQ